MKKNQIIRDDLTYSVIEYGEKGDFFALLEKKKKFPLKIALYFFLQLIDGLIYLEELNLSHMDIKLENLVFDKDLNLKIIDFGFSHRIKDEQGSKIEYSLAIGSEGYVPPEVINGKHYCNKVDVFSAGVFLFLLLLGHPPFSIATQKDKFYSLLLNNPAKYWDLVGRSKIPKESIDLFTKMFCNDPELRLSLEEVRNHDFLKGEIASKEEVKEFLNL